MGPGAAMLQHQAESEADWQVEDLAGHHHDGVSVEAMHPSLPSFLLSECEQVMRIQCRAAGVGPAGSQVVQPNAPGSVRQPMVPRTIRATEATAIAVQSMKVSGCMPMRPAAR